MLPFLVALGGQEPSLERAFDGRLHSTYNLLETKEPKHDEF